MKTGMKHLNPCGRKLWYLNSLGLCIFFIFMEQPWVKLHGSGFDSQSLAREDQDLNEEYRAAQGQLNEAGQAFLKSVQRAWIFFKEKDFPILTRVAISGGDADRAYYYQREEIQGRIEDLKNLGKPHERASRREKVSAAEADRMLNYIYRTCLQMLPPDLVPDFKAAQALWIQYRDLHCQFDAALKHVPSDEATLSDVTMRRVVNFRHYMLVLMDGRLPLIGKSDDDQTDEDIPLKMNSPDIFRFAR